MTTTPPAPVSTPPPEPVTVNLVMPPTQRDWPALLLTPAVTMLSIAVAAFGIIYTVRANTQAERDRNRSAFQLAAAEVVMGQPTCKLSEARARQLVQVFPALRQPLRELTQHPLSAQLCKQLRTTTKGNYSALFTGGIFSGPSLTKHPTLTVPNPFYKGTTTNPFTKP